MALRGGVVGCGMISEFHLRAWQRIPEVEIVALANRTRARAEARRIAFCPGARLYDSLEQMLHAERLDFVDILTVPELHRRDCEQAMSAGVHIICQKPLASTIDDARVLAAAAAGYPRVFVVHENHRYRPWFRRILDAHRKGFFGVPRLVRIEQHDPSEPPEAYKVALEQAVLLEYGTHLTDLMLALLGPAQRVYARMSRLNPKVAGESQALAVYEYAETTAVIDIAWKRDGIGHGRFALDGDAGSALYEGTMARGERARFRLVQGAMVVLDESRSPYDDYVESFYAFERHCVEAMLGRGPAPQPVSTNLICLLHTFAAYEAAARGRLVPLVSA